MYKRVRYKRAPLQTKHTRPGHAGLASDQDQFSSCLTVQSQQSEGASD